jgi:hypothetical protein
MPIRRSKKRASALYVAISAFKVASTPLAANFSSVVCLKTHYSLQLGKSNVQNSGYKTIQRSPCLRVKVFIVPSFQAITASSVVNSVIANTLLCTAPSSIPEISAVLQVLAD